MHPPASSPSSSSPSSSALSQLVFGPGGAATLSGLCEIMIFHPLDTTAKRLMNHHHRVVVPNSLSATMRNAHDVVFAGLLKNPSTPTTSSTTEKEIPKNVLTMGQRVAHLYPGSAWAVSYKVCQRFIKFAGQPYAKDYLESHRASIPFLKPTIVPSIDGASQSAVDSAVRCEKRKKMALEATAGCLVGVSEIILLPLDRMKVLSQTNPQSLQKGAASASSSATTATSAQPKLLRSLYAGAGVTAIRNAPGSFLLFGGAAFTKEYVFQLEDYRKATFAQNLVASTVGAMLGVLFTSPMDVVKTRIQSRGLGEQKTTGLRVVGNILKEEGPSAFYKGIVPKLIATAPRLVFSYTMTQYWTAVLRGVGGGGSGNNASKH